MDRALLAILAFIISVISYPSSLQYKELNPLLTTATSLKSLVAGLIEREEGFDGNISVNVSDPSKKGIWDVAEIKVFNKAIYDDSVGPIEYIAIAKRIDDKWKITHYKVHWKCKRDLIKIFWRTTPCS
jgi:hypothetical protein